MKKLPILHFPMLSLEPGNIPTIADVAIMDINGNSCFMLTEPSSPTSFIFCVDHSIPTTSSHDFPPYIACFVSFCMLLIRIVWSLYVGCPGDYEGWRLLKQIIVQVHTKHLTESRIMLWIIFVCSFKYVARIKCTWEWQIM